jgi:hypothetical protein
MKSAFLKTSFFISALFIFVSLAYADGFFVSEESSHLYSPDQKAVISWDGKIEEMILSSSVKTENLENIAWVVPIQSSVKPEVEAGNIRIFKDLVEYFKGTPHAKADLWSGRAEESFEGVEVVETKKVDIYDVAILKANDAKDLLDWLNANGYKTPQEAMPLFQKYVGYQNMYFVANKINLKNKYQKELAMRDKAVGIIKIQAAQAENALRHLNPDCEAEQGFTDDLSFEKAVCRCVVKEAQQGLSADGKGVKVIPPQEPFPNVWRLEVDKDWVISFSDFERLRRSYFFINYKNATLLTDFFPREDRRDVSKASGVSQDIIRQAESYADRIRQIISSRISSLERKDALTEQAQKAQKMLADVTRGSSQDGLLCNPEYYAQYYDADLTTEVFKEILPRFKAGELKSYCDVRSELTVGMATPLKIKFQPEFPYYPLEISSLGNGKSLVEVYVIAKEPVYDINKVMLESVSKPVDDKLSKKLAGVMNIGNPSYVTRLTWEGELKDLKADARFAEYVK